MSLFSDAVFSKCKATLGKYRQQKQQCLEILYIYFCVLYSARISPSLKKIPSSHMPWKKSKKMGSCHTKPHCCLDQIPSLMIYSHLKAFSPCDRFGHQQFLRFNGSISQISNQSPNLSAGSVFFFVSSRQDLYLTWGRLWNLQQKMDKGLKKKKKAEQSSTPVA